MFSAEYTEIRALAVVNHKALGENHPCVAGKAKCCEDKKGKVPLLKEDEIAIEYIIHQGRLTTEDLKRALKRAERVKNNKHNACPLLNEQRLCIVHYEDAKPVLCLMTGAAVLPKSRDQAEALWEFEGKGIPFSALASSMCRSCHDKLVARGAYATVYAIEDTQRLVGYRDKTTTRPIFEFVLDRFPQLIAEINS